jgi:hypothetical protein
VKRLLVGAALTSLAAGGLVASTPGASAVTLPTIRHAPMLPAQPETRDSPSLNAGWSSDNWSGYALSGNYGTFSSVAGCWDVPTIPISSPDSYSSTWVGIDGYDNSELIQTGTTQASIMGATYYYDWWEILPNVPFNIALVDPGDEMCASITEGTSGDWTIAIKDETSGDAFSTVQAYSGDQSSAEWIMERPFVCANEGCTSYVISTLADYGEMTFEPVSVNGGNPGLNTSEVGSMFNSSDQVISAASSPDGSTDGFNLAYGSVAPAPPPTVSPGLGPATGGQAVTINGGGFTSGATVTFGSKPATDVTFVSSSEITATTPAGSGTVSVTVTNPSPSDLAQTDYQGYTYVPAGAYTALQPFRVCDTRSGNSTACSGETLTPDGTLDVQVTGVEGGSGQSVPSDAQSVVLNVTAISGSADTYLTVFPAGSLVPTTSNLNVGAISNQANLVVVALGSGGQVGIYNSLGYINVAVDVEGYFAAPTVTSSIPGLFHPMSPLRICDTRRGAGTACSGTSADNLLDQNQWTKVVVSGCPTGDPACSAPVPSNGTAAAVALNLTAVNGSASTFLSVVPPNGSDACPTGAPSFSNLNVGASDNLPNRVIVPLGPEQDVCVYNSLGSINFILDLNGWFGTGAESSQGAAFYAVSPLRLCDTRGTGIVGYSTECAGETLSPGESLPVPVAGVDGLPASGGTAPPVALIANVTAVAGTSETYFTLYPASASQPLASDLNVNASQNCPNLVIVQLSSSGDVDLYNSLGYINAILDVAGWFQ